MKSSFLSLSRIMNILTLVLLLAFLFSLAESGGRRSRTRHLWKQENQTLEGQEEELHSDKRNHRRGKLFSLFNVVTFQNDPCSSTATLSSGNGNRNGTCFTTTECADKGGTAQGNCASGFGVCCIFLVNGENGDTIVNQNCSYIQNPGFPGVTTATNGIIYSVNRCNEDVCQLRLDFEVFDISGVADTNEINGGICQDNFQITGPPNHQVPVICGQNTGQHIYVDAADPTTLSFNFDGALNDNRQWDIKITQIECTNANRAPNGCLQYHTTITGRITTFNFAPMNEGHLRNQQYSVCVRPCEGFCCVQYTVCQDVMLPFSIDTSMTMAMQDDLCVTNDYIGISNSGPCCNQGYNLATDSRYCGGALNTNKMAMAGVDIPICDCTHPFMVDVFTNGFADGQTMTGTTLMNSLQSRGVCLDYMQIPCE